MAYEDVRIRALQADYLEFVPYLRRLAYRRTAGKLDWHAREEFVQEVCSLGWKRYLSLRTAGKHPEAFPHLFVWRVVQHVLWGHRLAQGETVRDVMRRTLAVGEDERPCRRAVGVELLALDGSDPAELAAAALDWAQFRARLRGIRARIADMALEGHGTHAIAEHVHRSASSVSVLRREIAEAWRDRADDEI